jgi:hypothetical protein
MVLGIGAGLLGHLDVFCLEKLRILLLILEIA